MTELEVIPGLEPSLGPRMIVNWLIIMFSHPILTTNPGGRSREKHLLCLSPYQVSVLAYTSTLPHKVLRMVHAQSLTKISGS